VNAGRLTRKKQIHPVAAHDETMNRFGRIDTSFDGVEKADNRRANTGVSPLPSCGDAVNKFLVEMYLCRRLEQARATANGRALRCSQNEDAEG
jgi:hypothetical protein